MAGTLVITTLSDGTNSTSATNCIQGSAKAWVNFLGANGTVNGSYNVSSVTRLATGAYTINLTTAMPNTNYSTASSFVLPVGNTASMYELSTTPRTTSAYTICVNGGGIAFDPTYLSSVLFSS
jgi:hypothetical protein